MSNIKVIRIALVDACIKHDPEMLVTDVDDLVRDELVSLKNREAIDFWASKFKAGWTAIFEPMPTTPFSNFCFMPPAPEVRS